MHPRDTTNGLRPPAASGLSIVIPYYEEPAWLPRVLADLETALSNVDGLRSEIIVVDDGSPTPAAEVVAARKDARPSPRVLRQQNAGRFAARHAGLRQARHELLLFIDSRVSIDPGALAFAIRELKERDRRVWNAHVEIDVVGNPYAAFWDVLTRLSYAEYFDRPRTASFDTETFDRFPKGTTCFLAPTDVLRGAFDRFAEGRGTLDLANDDTPIIRDVASAHEVWISPRFGCTYRSRTDLRRFLAHAHHRGSVFVDGHAVAGGRFLPVIAAFFPVSLVATAMLLARPRVAIAAAAAGALAVGGGVGARLRSAAAGWTIARLIGPWALAFGAGMWRVPLRALRRRAQRTNLNMPQA